jgi:uncharacterized membrane protein YdbT with pleckstrin-like domain
MLYKNKDLWHMLRVKIIENQNINSGPINLLAVLLTYTMQTSKTYKSRLDNWLVAVMVIPFLTVIILSLFKGHWLGIIIVLPVTAFIAHLFATTDYTINDNTLIVRSGFFVKASIDIATIRSIAETNTILSAPATS